MTEPTPQMVQAFKDAWHGTRAGADGDRTRAGLRAALRVAADDPSKDPVGTVRADDFSTAVKTGNYHHGSETYEDRLKNGWVLIGNGTHTLAHRTDSQVVGWEVIGTVPGTPAAEAQKPREPWTGDGSEEPPAHVTKVRDKHGCVAERKPLGWGFSGGGASGLPLRWDRVLRSGPYTEVVQ